MNPYTGYFQAIPCNPNAPSLILVFAGPVANKPTISLNFGEFAGIQAAIAVIAPLHDLFCRRQLKRKIFKDYY
jgi:hypothetical protein